ncbi:hydroxymethylbilane synthase [Thiotrichales bacterium 19S9-12]|nr:hydroxymethylbilane synthase [Thiotrichales bacterium 19S9-11]MCF6811571.1 hydroxymethylbilane synthase [Thiotrichales bacterium 19S9-12]
MQTNMIRIATRKSPLALWQAEYVKSMLTEKDPNLNVELILLTTEGDKRLETPLSDIGGKGLFMKELEVAIKNNLADIAVHSLKDVPYELPDGFSLGAFCQRQSPFDAFVSNEYSSIESLKKGAIVGTASLRRQAQLLNIRPDLNIKSVRGNINTRLKKLDDGEYDALILASAGLLRLGLDNRITQIIPDHQMLPAAGQGVVTVEYLTENKAIAQRLAKVNHRQTEAIVLAERSANQYLKGSCHTPIGLFATEEDQEHLLLRAIILSADGKEVIKAESLGHDPVQLGKHVAESLLKQGAKKLLNLA